MTAEELLVAPLYGTNRVEKQKHLLSALNALTVHHVAQCPPYRDIIRARNAPIEAASIEEVLFLPVRLFKMNLLKSVSDNNVFKLLTSSGTTGAQLSQIALDASTAKLQTLALVKILQSFIGVDRLPMLFIDHPGVIKTRDTFSARGAGILGMANFGRDHSYALTDDAMALDLDKVESFLRKYAGQKTLIFGFTFMVWEYLIRELERRGRRIDLSGGILVHSGGWKKLSDQAVDNASFKQRLAASCGIKRVHNFYGMVEQVGSIFVECEHGRLHAPAIADVIVRDPYDWRPLPPGREGLIQVLSCLPHSYPGHSLLTEDWGVLRGEDDCPCGRQGRTFEVLGRIAQAEARGCSDTFTAETFA